MATLDDTAGPGPLRTEHRRWWGLAATLLAAFMGNIDVFIVNVAAPALQTDLGADFGQIQLVLAGYVLAYAVGLVAGGRVGDRWGRKRVFVAGLSGFVVFSAACAAAPTAAVLIGLRVGHGVAAALMLPQVLSLIQASFEPHERARALSYYGAVLGLGSIAGLLLGGLLLAADPANLSWRSIFLVNVPVGLVALVLAAGMLDESYGDRDTHADLLGTGLVALGLLGVLYPLMRSPTAGWSWPLLATLAAGTLAMAGFLRWEQRLQSTRREPLLAPRLFTHPGFRLGLPAAGAFYTGNAGLYVTLTYFLHNGLGYSPLAAGIAFLPLGIGFACSSLASGPVLHAYGPRVVTAGAVVMALAAGAALSLTLLAHPATTPWPLFAALGAYGLGGGLVAAPLINTVLTTVPAHEAGVASGALLTTQQVANTVGIATIGTLYNTLLGTHPRPDYTNAFSAALAAITATAIAVITLLSLLNHVRPHATGRAL